jgi:hypothetical protein
MMARAGSNLERRAKAWWCRYPLFSWLGGSQTKFLACPFCSGDPFCSEYPLCSENPFCSEYPHCSEYPFCSAQRTFVRCEKPFVVLFFQGVAGHV